MRLFYNNLIDGEVTLTPTSEAELLPVENIANELPGRPWRTGNSTATERVVIDLGSAQSVTAVILFAHTLTASDSAILLEGNSADSWGAPAFSQSLTWSADAIAAVFASQSFRYWRLSFTKSAAGETRDLGRVYMGTYYDTTEQPSWDGYETTTRDLSRKLRTPSGQIYADLQTERPRLFRARFNAMPGSQATALRTFYATVGEAVSFFAQVETSGELTEILYAKLAQPLTLAARGLDTGGALAWDGELQMEETI